MALPVSIGDAILLSKLAYRLGHAVTAGRKKAPHGVREVQNQLFSLGKALNSVEQCLNKTEQATALQVNGETSEASGRINDEQHVALREMLKNCQCTLEEMETLISRYDDSSKSSNKGGGSRSWQREAKANLKKVKWTMETNELDKIRGNLNVHITSLNLLLSGMNHSHSRQTIGRLEEVHSMMSDIHEWYTRTIKGLRTEVTTSVDESGPTAEVEHQSPIFALSEDIGSDLVPALHCPRASFETGWVGTLTEPWRLPNGVFRCHCSETSHFDYVIYRLLPISLLVRLGRQEHEWHIFCFSDKITPLRISGLRPNDLAVFQDQVDLLAAQQAAQSITKGANSSAVYHSLSENRIEVSILDDKSELSMLQGQISSVTLLSQARRFTQRSIDTVQYLHYRTQVASQEKIWPIFAHQTSTDLLISSVAARTDIVPSKLVVKLTRRVKIVQEQGSSMLQISDVNCELHNENGTRDCKKCDQVEFVCTTARAARKLFSILVSAIEHLQTQYLQYPRFGERLLAQKTCTDAMISHLYLESPQAIVVFDPETQLHRLILRSSSLANSVTFELPDGVLKRLQDATVRDTEVDLRAYFVQHTPEGIDIESASTRFPREVIEAPSDQMRGLDIRDV